MCQFPCGLGGLGSSEPKTVVVVKAKPSLAGAPSWTRRGWVPSTAASGYLMWRASTNETTGPSSDKQLPPGRAPSLLPFVIRLVHSRFRQELSPLACGVLRGPLPWPGLRGRLLLQRGGNRSILLSFSVRLSASSNGTETSGHAEGQMWFRCCRG